MWPLNHGYGLTIIIRPSLEGEASDASQCQTAKVVPSYKGERDLGWFVGIANLNT